MSYLKRDFFERDVLTVARDLIGVELVWKGCATHSAKPCSTAS